MSEKKTQLQSWETIKSTAEVLYNSFVNSVTTNSQTGLKSFNSKKLEKLQSFLKENKTSYRKLNLDVKKIKEYVCRNSYLSSDFRLSLKSQKDSLQSP
jgi:hypothetical protein